MVTWIKQVAAGDTGTATKIGSDQWNIMDKYFGNVDVTASLVNLPQIATPTTFNSGILKIGNDSNSNKAIFTSSAQTGNFNINIPVLTGNVDLPIGTSGAAQLSAANTFTAIQTIQSDNQRVLKLYRPTNTANNICGIEVDHRNSSNAQTEFARWVGKLITNTAGAEVGMIEEYVNKAGTVTKVRTLDQNGTMLIGPSSNVNVNGLVYNLGTALDTASSNAEFDMINYTVPANLLGANGLLHCVITGYLLQNQATATDFTIKVKFGGTTIYNALTNIVQGSANLPFILHIWLGNNNSTSAQACSGWFILQDTGTTGLTTGEGCLENDEISVNANFRAADGASTKDTTSNQTFAVTMTMSVSNANVKTNIRRRTIEFWPGV